MIGELELQNNNMKSVYITKGGLLTALGVILIYSSTLLPFNKLYILIAASAIIPFTAVKLNIKSSILTYASTSILSFIVCGLKGTVLAYLFFFGIFGIVKYYIEKLKNILIEIFLKLLFFNFSLSILYFLFKGFFTSELKFKFSPMLIIIVAEVIFIIYDYALTLFIDYIGRHFTDRN